jgi:hypothetical protein
MLEEMKKIVKRAQRTWLSRHLPRIAPHTNLG